MHHQTIVIGRITRDPESKHLPSGQQVTEFGVAVNERFKRRDGSQGEHTEFYNCRAYGRLAEVISQYRRKGDPVFLQGRKHTDQWERDGQPRSKEYLNVDLCRGLAKSSTQDTVAKQLRQDPPATAGSQGADDYDDDIPF